MPGRVSPFLEIIWNYIRFEIVKNGPKVQHKSGNTISNHLGANISKSGLEFAFKIEPGQFCMSLLTPRIFHHDNTKPAAPSVVSVVLFPCFVSCIGSLIRTQPWRTRVAMSSSSRPTGAAPAPSVCPTSMPGRAESGRRPTGAGVGHTMSCSELLGAAQICSEQFWTS